MFTVVSYFRFLVTALIGTIGLFLTLLKADII